MKNRTYKSILLDFAAGHDWFQKFYNTLNAFQKDELTELLQEAGQQGWDECKIVYRIDKLIQQ